MLDAWLTLYYTPKIGSARLKQLLDYFGSANNAVTANNLAWQDAGMPAQVLQSRPLNLEEKVIAALQWASIADNHILHYEHEHYPPLLKEIYNPPMILFVQGNLDILSLPQIAIVGARKPTKEGFYNANLFASELANAGLVITSGLALGIDYTAHKAAVKLEKPTIAVLGTGLNEIYPKKHTALSRDILETGGALMSEYPLHMPAKPQNFPRRNRIIAGLSLGTLVVEAAPKSGSLITARLSMEENREVFTIPGSIHKLQSRGCHQLIREGASLVETTFDIRTALKGWIDIALSSPQSDIFGENREEFVNDQANSDFKNSNTLSNNALNRSSNGVKSNITQKKVPPSPRIVSTKLKAVSLAEDHPQYGLYTLLASPHSINQLVEILNISASAITTDLMMLEIEGVIQAEQGFYRQK